MNYARSELRKATTLVVMKDGKYLSRINAMIPGTVTWDQHLSNAWRTRDREKAREKAEEVGGILALFNPIIWEVKLL